MLAVRQSKWDERIARARALAAARSASAEVLSFYAALAEFQRSMTPDDAEQFQLSAPVDLTRIVGAIRSFLPWLAQHAPHPTESLGYVSNFESTRWHDLVRTYLIAEGWGARHREPGRDVLDDGESLDLDASEITSLSNDADRLVVFILEAVLQPLAEQLPMRPGPRFHSQTPMRCPRCAALPVAAVLREAGHGARRSLLCALCLTEWECPRVVCPVCGEREFEKLPVYSADQFAHVRIDGCDRCRHYLKTIDLSKDGTAVPCVDDIASVSLDLWAREQGYVRVKRNVLGL